MSWTHRTLSIYLIYPSHRTIYLSDTEKTVVFHLTSHARNACARGTLGFRLGALGAAGGGVGVGGGYFVSRLPMLRMLGLDGGSGRFYGSVLLEFVMGDYTGGQWEAYMLCHCGVGGLDART